MEHVASSLEALRSLVAGSDAAMVTFTEPSCQVGAAVEQKALALVREEFPRLDVILVDTVQVPEAAGQYEVLTIPTLVLFFAGRETARFVRTFGIDEVRQAIERPYAVMFE
ncbi:MAG: thioredoxin family protein [Deltaproteobacteria bacterium]|nr:thioredoxin family protein [Deltaproteobacteria bacterium]